MRAKGIATVVGALFLITSQAARADSGQIVATQNIGDICNLKPVTHRTTVVYVDLASVKKNEQEWGLTLLNKLELAPREHLTILGVNPSTFEVTEVFDSCYPILMNSEIVAAQSNRGLWDSLTKLGPEAQQRENIETFNTSLRSSLNKLVDAAGKLSLDQRRDILGAVAIDKNRFEDRHSFYRLIMYSHGDIAEPGVTKLDDPQQVIRALSEKYSTSFSGADVYVYGVDGQDRPLESKATIFAAFFLNNWGLVRSFSPSLPPQQSVPIRPVVRMSGTFQGGGSQGSVKLSYTTVEGLDLKEAWLDFSVGTKSFYVPFEGEASCQSGDCTLRATCLEDIPFGSKTPYFRKGDKLALSGKADGDLKGTVEPAAPEVFKTDSISQPSNATGGVSGKPERVDYTLTFHPD
jgi:hypothetical protein